MNEQEGRGLDAVDRRILEALGRDGRMSNLSLARAVNLTPTPCKERVRRLEREGYIMGYTARIDPARVGLKLLLIVHVTLDHGEPGVFERFLEALKAIPEVTECLMVTGQFDYLLKVRVPDMNSYRAILGDRLSAVPGVSQTNTIVVIEESFTEKTFPLGKAPPRSVVTRR
jgi:Lrp/AsnC family leucine-responsive transcriptional regulator